MEHYITHTQNLVQFTMGRHTYTVLVSNQRSALPAEVLRAIPKLRRRWQPIRNLAASRRFRDQSPRVTQLLLDANTDLWDSTLESLEVDHASIWRVSRN